MFTFDLQLFGGKGPKVVNMPANIPQASPTEIGLQQRQLDFIDRNTPLVNQLLNMSGHALLNQQVNPNPSWQDMYTAAQNQTANNNRIVQGLMPMVNSATDTANNENYNHLRNIGAANSQMVQGNKELGVQYDGLMDRSNNAFSQLMGGALPSSYQQNRQQALNSDLKATVGSAIAGLASRGIINSSQANSTFNDITRNASDTLARQFSSDMQIASGITGQGMNNQLNLLNGKAGLVGDTFRNQLSSIGQQAGLTQQNNANNIGAVSTLSQLANQSQQMAMDPIQTAATAQEASINVPMKYLSMATGQNAPAQNLLGQMSNQRYSVASPAQTMVTPGSGGFFGGIMSGLGSYFGCFPAGVMISNLMGSKPIEEYKKDDVVLANGKAEKVKELHNMGEQDIYIVKTSTFEVPTTATQTLLCDDKFTAVKDLSVGDKVMTVNWYEPILAIENIGRKEVVYELELTGDNVFYANGIMAQGLTEEDKQIKKPVRRTRKSKVE